MNKRRRSTGEIDREPRLQFCVAQHETTAEAPPKYCDVSRQAGTQRRTT